MGAPMIGDRALLEIGITVFGQDLKEIRVRRDKDPSVRPYVAFVTNKDEIVSVYLDDLDKEGKCPRPRKSKKSAS